jgi:hypothetical protein
MFELCTQGSVSCHYIILVHSPVSGQYNGLQARHQAKGGWQGAIKVASTKVQPCHESTGASDTSPASTRITRVRGIGPTGEYNFTGRDRPATLNGRLKVKQAGCLRERAGGRRRRGGSRRRGGKRGRRRGRRWGRASCSEVGYHHRCPRASRRATPGGRRGDRKLTSNISVGTVLQSLGWSLILPCEGAVRNLGPCSRSITHLIAQSQVPTQSTASSLMLTHMSVFPVR